MITTTPSSEVASDVLQEQHTVSGSDVDTCKMTMQNNLRNTAKTCSLSAKHRGIKSAIGLSWLLPILCAMCIPMIHKIMGHRSNEWWLGIASFDFVIFSITEILLLSLFILLFITLLKHLIYLTKKYRKTISILKNRYWSFTIYYLIHFET